MPSGSIKNSKDAERGKKTQFKKGQSGNPAGRPAKLPDLDQLMIKVLTEEQNGVTAMEAILKKMVVEAIVKGNMQAAQVVLDRAYGKSKQPIQLFNPKGEPVKFGYGDEKPV